MVECWSDGVMGKKVTDSKISYPNTPILQYSNTPALQHSTIIL
jgi:hypothetical protein